MSVVLSVLAMAGSTLGAQAQTLLLKPGGADSTEASPVPEDLAFQRARAFLTALGGYTSAEIVTFVEENFRLGSSGSADRWFSFISSLRQQTGGGELISLEATDPAEVELVVRNRVTDWLETMTLMLEPEMPHRLEAVAVQSPAPPADMPDGRLTDERLAREAEDLLSALEEADAFSGAVLMAREGRVILAEAYGEANKDFSVPNQIDTRFNLGSMNKMFTAVAVAQLVEAGKLSFDDPLSNFLPDHFASGVAEKIQIKHLLSHTSGLGNYFNEQFENSSRARLRTISDMLELVRGDSLAFEPGTDWRYSNTGFLVLGRIIELASGTNYHDYVRANIYRPAGMGRTGEFDLDRVTPNLAVGYQREYTRDGMDYRNNLFRHVIRGGPAGGGFSTVEDLHRFARSFMAGELVSERMVETLTSAKPELSSPRYGYGFGLVSVDTPEGQKQMVGHGGGFPGVSAQLDMDPQTGVVLVVLSNYGDGIFRPLGMRKLLLR